jgi:hypothetical protein
MYTHIPTLTLVRLVDASLYINPKNHVKIIHAMHTHTIIMRACSCASQSDIYIYIYYMHAHTRIQITLACVFMKDMHHDHVTTIQLGLPQRLGIPLDKMQRFILGVRDRMLDNPYHNWTHIFDVTQTVRYRVYTSACMHIHLLHGWMVEKRLCSWLS